MSKITKKHKLFSRGKGKMSAEQNGTEHMRRQERISVWLFSPGAPERPESQTCLFSFCLTRNYFVC